MIHSLSVKNYLSFKDEQTISFVASNKINDYEEHHVVTMPDGTKLLKLGVVYGANASGKSNLLNVFEFLKLFLLQTDNPRCNLQENIPFMLNNENRNNPSEFKLIFYANNIKHKYELVIKNKSVLYEKLDIYPGTQPANIFERKNEDGVSKINYGGKMKINASVKEAIELKCLNNISYFAAYNQVNTKIDKIENVINYFEQHILSKIKPNANYRRYTDTLINNDENYKTLILKFLKNAGLNISNIQVDKEDGHWTDKVQQVFENVKDFDNNGLIMEDVISTKILKTYFTHEVIINGEKENYLFPIDWQSEGTKRIYELSGPIQEQIVKDAFLAIDEIEAKLHPDLVEYLIESFLRDSNQAQLLITTHYDNLFDAVDLLRKDNFYFTEKGEDGATEVYRLADFKGLSRISSIQKAYRFGKFGAVPNIEKLNNNN